MSNMVCLLSPAIKYVKNSLAIKKIAVYVGGMKAKTLERYLAHNSRRSAPDMDRRVMLCRKARLLPSGSRGLAAPDINAKLATTILIAAFASDSSTDTADVVKSVTKMVPVEGSFQNAMTLGEALTSAMSNPTIALAVEAIEFIRYARRRARNSDHAETVHTCIIRWRDGGEDKWALYVPADEAAKIRDGGFEAKTFGGSQVEDLTRVRGGVIHQIAGQLAIRVRGGWVGDED